jgi:DTW domain-containing protein YfiP
MMSGGEDQSEQKGKFSTCRSSASRPPPAINIAPSVAQTQSAAYSGHKKSERQMCNRCEFPERTCICPSLPTNPLYPLLQKCRILVLQHPHELRRTNSSLPLAELCLFGRRRSKEKVTSKNENEFVMKTVVGRRFGDHCDEEAMKVLRDPNGVVVLVFPHKLAMDFEAGLRIAEERCCISCSEENDETNDENNKSQGSESTALRDNPNRKKMTLVFIDATWKHAKEMEVATDAAGEWPKNIIRVQMTPSSIGNSGIDLNGSDRNAADSKLQCDKDESQRFIQRRFLIRTPPSPDHLSTAECIAWIASRVENAPHIYESVTKVIDYMVGLWRGCNNSPDSPKRIGKNQMTQKKLKIG